MAAHTTKRVAPLGPTVQPSSFSSNTTSSLATDASPSSPDVLRTLYSALLKTRMLEEQVLAHSRVGKIPGVAVPVLGGEATEVAACIGLQPDDSFASSQPKLAAHVVRGTPLQQVFAELFPSKRPSSAAHANNGAGALRLVPQTSSLTGQLSANPML